MWNYGVEKTETQSTSTGEKPVICILKPHRGSWSAEYVEATWAPLKHLQVDWCHKISFLCRAPSLPLARNTLVAEGLKSNADYFLWLDADHIPESPPDINQALKLLYDTLQQTGESIVTALYRAKQEHGFNYAIWKEGTKEDGTPSFIHINSWPSGVNWFEVDVCGLGFTLMRRKVLEDMVNAGYGKAGKPFFHWSIQTL